MPSPQPAPLTPATQDLEQAFGVFNELSERLTTAYGQLEARVAAAPPTVVLVAQGVLLVIVLVVLFSRIEFLRG